MKEVYGDAWLLKNNYTYLAITTNGFVKSNGCGVMGRGIALEAKNRYPQIEKTLGTLVRRNGNIVQLIADGLLAFPVKHNWFEEADIELIKQSCIQLMNGLGHNETVLLPRPGCGNGKLNWQDVRPIIEPLLDNRITIVHK